MINMDINVERTLDNLVRFLSRLIDQGKSIHLKPHCDEKYKYHSLTGTSLENEVKVLPKYFPVELIMNQYSEVYGSWSSALAAPIDGRIYSLGDLMVFNSEESERSFRKFSNELCRQNTAIQLITDRFDEDEQNDSKGSQKEMTSGEVACVSPERGRGMISILIPTLNRSEFVIRALDYYAQTGFGGTICIGDSSEREHIEKTQRAIDRLNDRLDIVYRVLQKPPHMTQAGCVQRLADLVTTPYTVYAGDDDFLIPAGLDRCVDFLEHHPEYSAAHGARLKVKLRSSGASGPIEIGHYVSETEYESENAAERWIGYMRNAFATHFYVHRTETWQRIYRGAGPPELVHYLGEVLVCSNSVILGRIKRLDCLTSVFQVNDNLIFSWETTPLFSLMNEANWSASVEVLRASIVEALVQEDGMSESEAEELFVRELWQHVTGILVHQFQKKYANARVAEPTSILPSLLDPANPHYEDFRHVHQVVSGGPGDSAEEAVSLNQKGEEMFGKGDTAGAIGAFEEALQMDRTYVTAHNNLGVLHWQSGNVEGALEHLVKALEIDPNDQDTILNCGDVFASLNKTDDAREIYTSYLQRNPGDEAVMAAMQSLGDAPGAM